MATLSTLEPQVCARIEEVPGAPVFWSDELEVYSALQEAQCDLLLLVGRPDMTVSVPFSVVPNQWMQTVPAGVFAVTNLQGPSSEVWKIRLQDMDYGLVSGPDWEQDIGDSILKWFPLGFGKFGVWPSVAQPQTVLLTGIASPITGLWPYPGSTPVVFEDQFFVALEKYAASYARLKEGQTEFEEGQKLYADYLANAQRMSQLQDRRDPFIWDGAVGATTVVNPTKLR
jgi:hypothetical protein